MPRPYLEWYDENQLRQRRPLVDKIFLGRACLGVTPDKSILIKHPSVSRDHAVIQLSHDGVTITDQSTNGTWINQIRMAPGASRTLKDGDCIQLGGMSICLCDVEQSNGTADNDWSEPTIVRPETVTVTSLVADVRGFSSIAQGADSKAAYALMDEIISNFSEIIGNQQGTVKDYAGDAVFAFWEHGQAVAPQRAILACHAALEQLNRLDQIRLSLKGRRYHMDTLRLGWGLTTGMATLSHYGSRSADLALVGDCINLAFRFSSMADKEVGSRIIICSQTADLVNCELTLTDLGWVKTKGRTGKEHVFGIA